MLRDGGFIPLLHLKSGVVYVLVGGARQKGQARHDVHAVAKNAERYEPVQGWQRHTFHQSHHAQVEKSSCTDQEGQPDEMNALTCSPCIVVVVSGLITCPPTQER